MRHSDSGHNPLSPLKESIVVLTGCVVISLFGACNSEFSASAPSEQPRMVIYSILTTSSDTQYVRVYSSYDPPGNDPTRNLDEIPIQDAQVTIRQESGPTFSFRPMTIARANKSRYSSDILAYASYPFRPLRGKTYTLTVSSPSMGTATAKVTIPGQVIITPISPDVLSDPMSASKDFGLSVALAPEAKAYLARIYLDYFNIPGDGTYRPRRFEIPLTRRVISRYWGLYKEIYPRPTVRSTPANAPVVVGSEIVRPEERVLYSRAGYADKLGFVYERESPIEFRQAVFYAVQFDVALWNYYRVANLYQDRFSVRIDEADYTNVGNGFGVFGSMTVDSLIWHYIPVFIPHPQPD